MSDKEPTTPKPEDNQESTLAALRSRVTLMSSVQFGILLLAGAYTLYFIRPVLLPVILALLLTLVLKPIHRVLCQWIKIPAPLAAAFIMLGVVSGVTTGIYYLSAPAIEYTDELRNEIVKTRLKNVFQPISKIQAEVSQVATEVGKITTPEVVEGDGTDELDEDKEDAEKKGSPKSQKSSKKKSPPEPTKKLVMNGEEMGTLPASTSETVPVEVKLSKSPMEDLYQTAKDVVYHLVITMTLVFFLLAYGDKMIERITEVDVTAALMDELTNEISRYMFTITLINMVLGLVTGTAMWLLGMPNPLLWGVMAAILNYIPYIGALCGAAIVFIVAATNFDSTLTIIMIPAVYYAITVMEGNFITPAVLGKSFIVNPIIVFVWVLCWAALWGIPGMLIGLPILMVCRIICSKFPSFQRVERIISSS
ncbi:AI-2E family transporter [Oceaniferula spumae]|uniref:AI-2E family transporter n=1 Tax=Oceaniferula spumae TaxID=2979115 RepID=A0AAT9FP97_9BACT